MAPDQPPHPPQLLDLFGDPRFETTVQLRYLIGAFVQFADQPRILHCDHCLRGEVLQQRDLFLRERTRLSAVHNDRSAQAVFLAQGDGSH
jgi:hypothetical protein